jgi:hypothetical protein
MAKRPRADQANIGGETLRPTVTLPAFLHDQLSSLKGIYGPSLSEVVGFVLQSWLHDNDDRVQRQKERYKEFARRKKGPRSA